MVGGGEPAREITGWESAWRQPVTDGGCYRLRQNLGSAGDFDLPGSIKRARRWQPRGGGDDLHAGFDFETTLGGETLYSFLGTVGVKAPGSVLPERVTLGENLNVQAQPRASKKTPGVGSRQRPRPQTPNCSPESRASGDAKSERCLVNSTLGGNFIL